MTFVVIVCSKYWLRMCSATRLFTFFAVVVGFFAVIFTVDIFKPYRQNIIDVIPGYVNDTFTIIMILKDWQKFYPGITR